MNVQVGQSAPEFALPDQDGHTHRLSDYRGQWVVLYFYPKDDTSGCTTEACQMRDSFPEFVKGQAVILGLSVDSVVSHKKFATKYNLPFTLLSDQDKQVVQQYGLWVEKKFMGKAYMGTERTTLLINPEGIIAKIYQKVQPDGHAEMVMADLRRLQS